MRVPCKGEVMSAISLALPKCNVSGAEGYWAMLSGWSPANGSVKIDGFDPADTTGGSSRMVTAEITRRYADGDPKVIRHATDAFNAYAATYGGNRAVDPATARSAIGMAVVKIVKCLRADGFTVGASMANVGDRDDPQYVIVPWTYSG